MAGGSKRDIYVDFDVSFFYVHRYIDQIVDEINARLPLASLLSYCKDI